MYLYTGSFSSLFRLEPRTSARTTLGRYFAQSLEASTVKSNPSTSTDKKLIFCPEGRCVSRILESGKEGMVMVLSIWYFHFGVPLKLILKNRSMQAH